ncbi:MAG: phage tail protein [Paracoccaceae bacterium]
MPETAQAQTNAAQGAMPEDPLRAFQFQVEIGGVTAGHFTEVTGLGVRVEPIKYREGGLNQIVRHIPGRVDYAEVTLRYGLTRGRELWDWMHKSIEGRVDRRDISILMLDASGSAEALRWNLFAAWPSEWQGASLDALGREIAVETLKLAFDRLERA